ncbi:MAG TPA: adventurous gliding motility protein CglE [Anaeromyxobacteraceae bacterium]|nr:adventurous gliding motility protein CglE [Anaeromyxobacteraceae bacterium]
MRSVTTRAGLLAALLAAAAGSGAARAQDAGPASIEDPRAARFADVERGVSFGMEAGGLWLTKTPTKDKAAFPYAGDGGGASRGLLVGMTFGVDLGQRLGVAAVLLGTSQRAGTSYGAFDLLAAGLDLRYAFYGKKDRNDWERFYVYAHARGGYALSHPKGLFGDTDTLVAGGLGVEYYTQLRHFSVGLQVDGVYAVSAKAPGFSVSPVVRYTF